MFSWRRLTHGDVVRTAGALRRARPTFRFEESARSHGKLARSAALVLFLLHCALVPAVVSAESLSQPARLSSTGSRESLNPQFSDDDRWCIFVSLARNLTTNDVMSPWLNVYARDLATSSGTELVSARNQRPGGGNGNSSNPASSADGRWIAFQSDAGDLLEDGRVDTNRVADIYLRDRQSGVTSLISVSTNGSAGNSESRNPRISGDGRFVVFESAATDLVADDTNRVVDIFIRDRWLGITRMVSADADVVGPSAGDCELASITPDARRVLFVKSISPLNSSIRAGSEVYLRDLVENSTRWLSAGVLAPSSGTSSNRCLYPALSEDGRVAVFLVIDPLLRGQVFRWKEASGLARIPLGPSGMNAAWTEPPALSRNGRYIAAIGNDYAAYSPTYNQDAYFRSHTVFLHNTELGTTDRLDDSCSTTPHENCRSPVFSGDGSLLAFTGFFSGGYTNIKVVQLGTNCGIGSISERAPVVGGALAVSSNGRMIAFESDVADLVPADYNQATDVFLWRSGAGLELVSARAANRPALTGHRSSTMEEGASSADGSVIAFASQDNQLVEGDINPGVDIFVRERSSGRTLPASSFIPPSTPGGSYRSYPALSADGRFIAFQEDLTNVVWVDRQTRASKRIRNGAFAGGDIIARDEWRPLLSPDGRYLYVEDTPGFFPPSIFSRFDLWELGVPEVVMRPARSLQLLLAKLSPDGRYLVFVLGSTEGMFGGLPNFRGIRGGDPRFVSMATESNVYRPINFLPPSGGTTSLEAIVAQITNFVFSANSRFVFFSARDSLGSNIVLRHDLEATIEHANTIVCSNCVTPSPRADGLEVAVEIRRGTGNRATNDVYVMNLATGARSLVNVGLDGSTVANASSYAPAMSQDGRYVAFLSRASNLVSSDANNMEDLFVRDRWTSTTFRVPLESGTTQVYPAPLHIQLSPDGRTLFYQSYRYDLDPGDYNLHSDLFALRLSSPDTDGDGIEDAWEMVYFDTLARDGNADFDGDGFTDRQEYQSGSDPTNRGSVLKVLSLTRPGAASTRLLWTSSPGRRYQVETKATVTALSWTPVGSVVTTSGTTATLLDTESAPSAERYYRVSVLP